MYLLKFYLHGFENHEICDSYFVLFLEIDILFIYLLLFCYYHFCYHYCYYYYCHIVNCFPRVKKNTLKHALLMYLKINSGSTKGGEDCK